MAERIVCELEPPVNGQCQKTGNERKEGENVKGREMFSTVSRRNVFF